MIELELLGTGADGQSLVLTDAEGERYSVPVTDELRGAVRRDRPRLETVPTPQARPLRPGEIQALLRSGLSAEELARESSMDIAHIRRFEAPVAAEKEWALSRALGSHVGGDRDAPVMGDLVVDRLAARGVDPGSLSWSARRPAEGPWEIALTFLQGAAEHAAHWTLAPSAAAVEAIDQEARWLTETAAPSPVSAVFAPLPTATTGPSDEREGDLHAREALLDQLNAARGHREGIDIPLDDEEDAEFGDTPPAAEPQPGSLSARIYSLAHARTRQPAPPAPPAATRPGDRGTSPAPGDLHEGDSPSGSTSRAAHPDTAAGTVGDHADADGAPGNFPTTPDRGHSGDAGAGSDTPGTPDTPGDPQAPDSDVLPGLEEVHRSPARPDREKKRGRRRSVPSWDEIVFGSKPQ